MKTLILFCACCAALPLSRAATEPRGGSTEVETAASPTTQPANHQREDSLTQGYDAILRDVRSGQQHGPEQETSDNDSTQSFLMMAGLIVLIASLLTPVLMSRLGRERVENLFADYNRRAREREEGWERSMAQAITQFNTHCSSKQKSYDTAIARIHEAAENKLEELRSIQVGAQVMIKDGNQQMLKTEKDLIATIQRALELMEERCEAKDKERAEQQEEETHAANAIIAELQLEREEMLLKMEEQTRELQSMLESVRSMQGKSDVTAREAKCSEQRARVYAQPSGPKRLKLLDAVLLRESDDDVLYSLRAYERNQKRDFIGAIEDCNKALALNPKNEAAYNNRAFAYNGLEGYEAAVRDCAKALELKPDYEEALANRAAASYGMRALANSLSDYSRLIELKPQNSALYNNRAYVRNELGDHQGALADCSTAIELDPTNDKAYINRVVAKYKLGDAEGAKSDYTRAVELNPGHRIVLSQEQACAQELVSA